MSAHCPACGEELSQQGPHPDCPAASGDPGLDPPRHCGRCGGRLDVQVFPTGYTATCRRCDGVHPAHRDRT